MWRDKTFAALALRGALGSVVAGFPADAALDGAKEAGAVGAFSVAGS